MKKGEKFQRVKISREEYNQLKKVEKKVQSAKVYKRIQTFKLIYKRWKYLAIAEFLSIARNTISEWIKIYKKGGIDSLITLHYRGGQPKLTEKQLCELRKQADEGSFTISKDIQHYIKKRFGIQYNLSHVQLLSKKSFTYPLRKQEKYQVNQLV